MVATGPETKLIDLATAEVHLVPVRGASTGVEHAPGKVIPLEPAARARMQAVREHEEVMLEALPAITYLRRVSDSQPADAYIFLNRQTERILGFTRNEWSSIPRLWAAQLHPEDRTRVLAEHARHVLGGDPFVAEYRIRHRDGSDRWLWHEAEIHPAPSLGGRVTLGVAVDVTDLRPALPRRLARPEDAEATVGRCRSGNAGQVHLP